MTMIKLKKKEVKKAAMQQALLRGKKNSNNDLNDRMPGQLSPEAPPLDYHGKRNAAIAHIETLIGKSFSIQHKNKSMTWTVADKRIPSDLTMENKPLPVLCKFDATEYT
jgi:hypothetical protein